MKVSDVLTGILLMLFGVAILVAVQSFPDMHGQDVGPALFPAVIAVGFLVCGALLTKDGLKVRPRAAWIEFSESFHDAGSVVRFLLVILVVVAYVMFSSTLGFITAAALLVLVLTAAFGVHPAKAVFVAIVGTLLVHYLFYRMLAVPLPWGLLEPIAW